jgi:site-specific DNA-methyltransferase (adenine-specific)
MSLANNCIDLTITSPPYDNIRKDKYDILSFDSFKKIVVELYRVTKKGGVVVWVVNDQVISGSESGTSFRQALYFIEKKFKLHDTMIYAKNSYIPLNHKRYEQQFEYMFIFSKGVPKTFNPRKISCITAGSKRNRKKAKTDDQGMRGREEITIVNDEKIMGNIWFYDVGKNDKTIHASPFPEKLVKDHILSWTNENDTILDIFLGSGTTAKIALLENRNYIGFETSKERYDDARKRINK